MKTENTPILWWFVAVLAVVLFASAIFAEGTLKIGGKTIPVGDLEGATVKQYRGTKVPRADMPDDTVSKEIIDSTGTNLIDISYSGPIPSAIMLTIYASGAETGVRTDEIVRWFDDQSGNYRKIVLKNGDIVNVSQTVSQIRIKLQNTGWLVF